MQKILKLVVIATAVAALAACGDSEGEADAVAPAEEAPLVVKIGHVGPTSGPIARLGQDNENGGRMAIEALNAANITLGGRAATFELLAQDDDADPAKGAAAARQLVASGVNGVVGHLNSVTTIEASKIYSDAGVPQISPSATNPKYTRQGFATTFRLLADDAQLGDRLGRYAVETLSGKAIAVIDDRTGYGQSVADAFEQGVIAAGGSVIAREFTSDQATDFTVMLTALKDKSPDVVFFGGMDAVAGRMLQQMKQLGIEAKLVGGDGICSSRLPSLAGDALLDDHVFCAEAGGVADADKPAMDKFRADFQAKYGTAVQVYAPYTYDAVMVIAQAMKRADSADPAVYLPFLAQTDGYQGLTGTISFDEKGDLKSGALTLMTYRGGARTAVAVIR
ncbi:branched-chain amino acid ABC transporter substrate-binding protein [Comamonadaceae bacterium M7527]|nr:branched-chain amino acid ABC transporter substrate-binding protein [Comamonadaceae bacterium M7527]